MKIPVMDPALKVSFVHFSRNGRWGACGDCPADANGTTYPECCVYTKRSDHNLTIDELADNYKRWLATQKA